ncbi:helix-turn-helix transcriptional regulator [Streptomyces sp. SID12488]|uniref:helix-turn-helix domain-containing protein n=1 Tax=Streptomyces sp. SID12488 TaxID=2706040 RepID=UPI0013DB91BB|nr:helix-turn-helix transcriptional regulator [Streptomyces sp. SID12488]NEA64265.1 helix-turn-helix transcriptional regulator [Streptomyces sp. SID12488]
MTLVAAEADRRDPLARLKEILRRGRLKKQLTVKTLAHRAGLGYVTVSKALNEGLPSEATIYALAKVLAIDPAPLIELRSLAVTVTEPPPPPVPPDTRKCDPVTPAQRDALRANRNDQLIKALERVGGIQRCTVFQLEDHTDNGYLLYVTFDTDRLGAASVLQAIRSKFEQLFPEIPYWGELKSESETAVGFAYTYIDPHNMLFQD